MIKKSAFSLILLTVLLLSMPTLVNAGKPPKVATFEIRFEGDIIGGPFTTVASAEAWEPQKGGGKGLIKIWSLGYYKVKGDIDLYNAPFDDSANDPPYGFDGIYNVEAYQVGSGVLDFFDVGEPITISMLKHFYETKYDWWIVELNQTNSGHQYYLEARTDDDLYNSVEDTWIVTFSGVSAWIRGWEWSAELGHYVSYYVWKGYLTFTIAIHRLL